MNRFRFTSRIVASILAASALASCKSIYYSTLEKVGIEKRDILVDRIEDAKEDQEKAKEQFQSALDKFKTVAGVDLGELEGKYDELRKAFERSEAKADVVRKDILSIESVAKDLFEEWKNEIDEIGSSNLRVESKRMLDETQERYSRLMELMKRAEQRIEPVLGAFRDQVLFLKHNLNAKAIAALQGNLARIELDVQALIREMERSIQEANAFVTSMESS